MNKTITDSKGNRITFDIQSRQIVKTVDRHGFIFNAQGKRTGNVHGQSFIKGYHDID